ncbi:hypothetical protein PINS_up018200 [Pythium insidiosum]|nr:hypothetical protein PINS_up018200 [Pythium insidiosum]
MNQFIDGVLDIEKSDLVALSGDNDEAYDESFYRRLAASHRSLVPSIMFFHMLLVEYAGAPSQKSTPLRIGSVYKDYVGCSDVDSHLFSALRDYGDVKATLVGHDHLNDFCYKREDIQLCYGGGAGLGRAYGSMYTPRHAALASAAVSSSAALAVSSHAALAVSSSAALAVSSRAALAVSSSGQKRWRWSAVQRWAAVQR